METTGNLVALGIEFTAGMQFGHDDLRGRYAFFLVEVHRNSTAIVDHRNGIIVMTVTDTSVA